ncbi:MAG TPA: hypothetical protein VLK29_12445, partial [Luteimonas sp.]|nr:hypothetical protein [Luteimonas sp.]
MSTVPGDRRARLDALFDQALDLDPAARAAFLAALGDGDGDAAHGHGAASLRAELEQLLAFAEEPSAALAADALAGGALWQSVATSRGQH